MSGQELVEAAKNGDLSAVRALLERGAQINSKSGYVSLFCTVLLSSQRVSSVSLLSSLLHFFFPSLLFSSLLSSSLLSSSLLLSSLLYFLSSLLFLCLFLLSIPNCSVYFPQYIYILKGGTALHNAARNGHLEVARLLIDRSADINMKDDGVTILWYLSSIFSFLSSLSLSLSSLYP